MSWQRFEERKAHGYRGYVVTLGCYQNRKKTAVKLYVNNFIRRQLLGNRAFVDVFVNPDAQAVGMRFLESPTDQSSYRFCDRKSCKGSLSFSITRLAQELGILEPLRPKPYRAELKHDPADGIYWFSVAPLLNGRGDIKARRPR